MKQVKKWMAFIIAVALILGMSSIAMAASITVENADPASDENASNETYEAYKIFDAVKKAGTTVVNSVDENGNPQQTLSENGAITYQITDDPDEDEEWFDVLFSVDEDGVVTPVEGQDWVVVQFIETTDDGDVYQVLAAGENGANLDSEEEARLFAEWLYANRGDISSIPLQQGENEVDDGYYLIVSSLGVRVGLATTDIPMTIVEKNTFPTIDKTQKDGEADADAAYADNAVDVQIGDTIDYQILIFVPESAGQDVVVTDTMSAGLTPGEVSAVSVLAGTYDEETGTFTAGETALVADGDETADYLAAAGTSPATFVFTIHPTANTRGKYIQITFSATVNEDAVDDTVKNNSAVLTYSNYTQTDTVEYDIYATGMVKYDGKDGTILPDDDNQLPEGTTYLADAEFQLLDADGKTVIPVAYDSEGGYYYPDENGTATITSVATATGIVIRGLDNHTYYLKETKAPDGYNFLPGTATLVVINSDTVTETNDGTTVTLTELTDPYIVKIQNNAGSLLPFTGGIGRTIFLVVGGVIVAAAVILLVVRRRRAQVRK